MWLLAELFEDLPEVGDLDKPKLVFFFDEAHLLFTGASKAFLESVTQTVRLIRSKGVGIFFVTQNPTDVPSAVLGQLGNRVQHALRTFTPEDAKALRKTVSTFPESDDYDIAEMLTSLGTGEAAVTVLSERGSPTPSRGRCCGASLTDGAGRSAVMEQVVAASPLTRHVRPGGRPGLRLRAAGRSARSAARSRRNRRRRRSCRTRGRRSPRSPSPRPDVVAPRHRRRTTSSGRSSRSAAFRSFARSAASALGAAHPRPLRQPAPPPLISQPQGALVSRAQIGQARSSPPSGSQLPSSTSTFAPHSARNGGAFRVATATTAWRSPIGCPFAPARR